MFILKNRGLFTVFNVFKITLNKSTSVRKMNNKSDLIDIFLKGVTAVQPKNLLQNTVRIENTKLSIRNATNTYKIIRPCYVIGFGKAVLGMAIELERILGGALSRGIVTVPTGIFETFKNTPELLPKQNSRIRFIEGAKDNLPDENAYRGALEIKNLISNLEKDDIVIVLISGGGSALLPLPKDPVTLEEKYLLVKMLSKAGANIIELNTVRKKLSELKGGGLGILSKPANVIALILSDIVGDPLDFIASGPTVFNTDDSTDALNIVKKYGLLDAVPNSVKDTLRKEYDVDYSKEFDRVLNVIIGNNAIACNAALKHAEKLGYETVILTTRIANNVEDLSKWYAKLTELIVKRSKSELQEFLEIAKHSDLTDIKVEEILNLTSKKICIVSGGEPTVVVKGKGRGGRNQELALRFSVEVNKLEDVVKLADVSFLSAGTDGIDGPTNAAGAYGNSNLVNNARLHDINPTSFLHDNDSYRFYCEFNDGEYLIRTGHTGTNVMDLHILIINFERM